MFDFTAKEGNRVQLYGSSVAFTLIYSGHRRYYKSNGGQKIITIWELTSKIVLIKQYDQTAMIFRKRFGICHGRFSNTIASLETANDLALPKPKQSYPNLMLASDPTSHDGTLIQRRTT